MRTDGEIDRLLRDEAERWRTGMPAAGDVDADAFTDVSTPGRIPRTLIAALSTAALAAVFVAVIGSRWLPVVDPVGSPTIGPPAAQRTSGPTASAERPAECRPDDFLQAARMVIYDYEPADSPRKLARMSDLVVIGRVAAGTAVVSETRGFDTHLAVDVSEVVRGDPELVVDGRIFVVVRSVDVSAMDPIQKLSSCDVLLFLTRHREDFAPGAQGFWIQAEEGLIGVHVPLESSPSGWDGITSIDDLRDAATYTPTERDEAQATVAGAVNRDRENFGGVYLDRADGTMVIQYVGDNAGRAAVEEVISPAVTVRWVKVERSAAELDRIRTEIRERNLPGVSMIGTDTIRNRLIVGVHPNASIDEVRQILVAAYGEAVTVVAAEVTVDL